MEAETIDVSAPVSMSKGTQQDNRDAIAQLGNTPIEAKGTRSDQFSCFEAVLSVMRPTSC